MEHTLQKPSYCVFLYMPLCSVEHNATASFFTLLSSTKLIRGSCSVDLTRDDLHGIYMYRYRSSPKARKKTKKTPLITASHLRLSTRRSCARDACRYKHPCTFDTSVSKSRLNRSYQDATDISAAGDGNTRIH